MKPATNDDQQELLQRLKKIEAAFDIDKLITRKTEDLSMIAAYYRRNKLAYKRNHSKEGFVHMGISRDGVFKSSDFYEQGRMVQTFINQMHPSVVLELAAGKATTTYYLAEHNPDVHFCGMDLPHGQLDVRAQKPSNLRLVHGDYHDLHFLQDSSQDIVYIIEALCYSTDRRRVIAEVARVLKPGGRFIIFDGYTTKQRADMAELERYTSDLTFKSMMVQTDDLYYGNFKDDLVAQGLTVEHEENLSQWVLPNMLRLEAKAAKLLANPHRLKMLTYLLSNMVTANTVAGYLMPLTVQMNIHQYWFTVAAKRT